MKFKIGDKVRVGATVDMDGIILGYGDDNDYAVKIKGFEGHNCEYVIRSGDLSSLENDGWWCGDEDLTLIEPAKAEKSKFKAGDKVELIQSNGVRSEGDIIELERLSCSGIWMDTEGLGNEENWFKLHKPKDSIVKSVRKDLKDRSNVGIKKYGVTLDRKDLSILEWHQHHYEELLDAALYTKKIITELKNK